MRGIDAARGTGKRMVTKRPERSLFVVACKDGRPGDEASK